MEYRISKFLKYFVIGLAFAVAVGLIVMLLWNWLIPNIFGGPTVTFLQAIGLLILAKILFGSTGPARVQGRTRWRKRFAAKMAEMSPEERARFREEVRNWREDDEAEKKE